MRSIEKRINFLFALAFANFGGAIEIEEKISGLANNLNRSTWLWLEETLHLLRILCLMFRFSLESKSQVRVSNSAWAWKKEREREMMRKKEKEFFFSYEILNNFIYDSFFIRKINMDG